MSRQGLSQRGTILMATHPSEPGPRPQQAARHPTAHHVLLLVRAFDLAGRFSPISQVLLEQVGAQEGGIVRGWNTYPLKARQGVLAGFWDQGGCRVAFGDELRKLGKDLFSGFTPTCLTKGFELPGEIRTVTSEQFVAELAIGVDRAFLLNCSRPKFAHSRGDSRTAIAQDEKLSSRFFLKPLLARGVGEASWWRPHCSKHPARSRGSACYLPYWCPRQQLRKFPLSATPH